MRQTPQNSTELNDWTLDKTPDVEPLAESDYDIVGSAVLFNTSHDEVRRFIMQFRMISSTLKLKTHLYLIDNSPQPILSAPPEAPDISHFFARRNLGYGRAHNLALRASRGRTKYNLIMNTDVTYAPAAVGALKHALDTDPRAGLAAPKIRYPDGTLQYVCRLLPKPHNVFLRRFFPQSRLTKRADHNYELRWWDHDAIANIPFFQASFLLIRSTILDVVDGFDERFFLYAEDIDLCRRIHQVAKTLYVPDATILHEFRRYSTRSLRGTFYSIRSHCQYFSKWGWFIDGARKEINARTINDLRATESGHK
ncbi:MAG: glycosyltransferase [Steroidobacteraceae bacterium]